jgi:hypothetical protein
MGFLRRLICERVDSGDYRVTQPPYGCPQIQSELLRLRASGNVRHNRGPRSEPGDRQSQDRVVARRSVGFEPCRHAKFSTRLMFAVSKQIVSRSMSGRRNIALAPWPQERQAVDRLGWRLCEGLDFDSVHSSWDPRIRYNFEAHSLPDPEVAKAHSPYTLGREEYFRTASGCAQEAIAPVTQQSLDGSPYRPRRLRRLDRLA